MAWMAKMLGKAIWTGVKWLGKWIAGATVWGAHHIYAGIVAGLVAPSAARWLNKQTWAGAKLMATLVGAWGAGAIAGASMGTILLIQGYRPR